MLDRSQTLGQFESARAGGTVYTCEDDPFIATMAKEIVGLNHLDHRIKVLKKQSQEVLISFLEIFSPITSLPSNR